MHAETCIEHETVIPPWQENSVTITGVFLSLSSTEAIH